MILFQPLKRSPSDAAVVKMLWLAVCNIEDKQARERFKDTQKKGCTPCPGAD